jgi:hypothetical protein
MDPSWTPGGRHGDGRTDDLAAKWLGGKDRTPVRHPFPFLLHTLFDRRAIAAFLLVKLEMPGVKAHICWRSNCHPCHNGYYMDL